MARATVSITVVPRRQDDGQLIETTSVQASSAYVISNNDLPLGQIQSCQLDQGSKVGEIWKYPSEHDGDGNWNNVTALMELADVANPYGVDFILIFTKSGPGSISILVDGGIGTSSYIGYVAVSQTEIVEFISSMEQRLKIQAADVYDVTWTSSTFYNDYFGITNTPWFNSDNLSFGTSVPATGRLAVSYKANGYLYKITYNQGKGIVGVDYSALQTAWAYAKSPVTFPSVTIDISISGQVQQLKLKREVYPPFFGDKPYIYSTTDTTDKKKFLEYYIYVGTDEEIEAKTNKAKVVMLIEHTLIDDRTGVKRLIKYDYSYIPEEDHIRIYEEAAQ